MRFVLGDAGLRKMGHSHGVEAMFLAVTRCTVGGQKSTPLYSDQCEPTFWKANDTETAPICSKVRKPLFQAGEYKSRATKLGEKVLGMLQTLLKSMTKQSRIPDKCMTPVPWIILLCP